MAILRENLPPLPERMKSLPVSDRGFPVPWFVQWLKDGKACLPGTGTPEFRMMDFEKHVRAIERSLCWVCGQPRGSRFAFVVGPMCGVNRISSEPPSHKDCAEFSAKACPFLSMPKMVRRDNGLPENVCEPGGISITRNPGVALLWFTRSFEIVPTTPTVLFRFGDPFEVAWYVEGREATRAEVMQSVETGLPLLLATCDQEKTPKRQQEARIQLEAQRIAFMDLLPKE